MIFLKTCGDLEFICEYCKQRFSHFTLNIAVLLYGIGFLERKNSGFACITCPSCIKTLLIKCDDISNLHETISLIIGPEDANEKADLGYSHLLPYYEDAHLQKIHELICAGHTFENRNRDEGQPDLDDLVSDFGSLNELWKSDLLISYNLRFGHVMGDAASVLWFKSDMIEEVVEVENALKIKILPRYYYTSNWHGKINNFCWEYHLFPKIILQEARSLQKSGRNLLAPLIDKPQNPEVEFLRILRDDPQPFNIPGIEINAHYSGLWKTILPFKEKTLPTEPEGLNLKEFENTARWGKKHQRIQIIDEYFGERVVHHFLNDNYLDFIKKYIIEIQKLDFSYATFWTLKSQYLENLLELIQKQVIESAPYAFYQTGPGWAIRYAGKTISPLKEKGFKYIQYLVLRKNKTISTEDLALIDRNDPEMIKSTAVKRDSGHMDHDDMAALDYYIESVANSNGQWVAGKASGIDGDDTMDKKTLKNYLQYIRELNEKIEIAELKGDEKSKKLLIDQKETIIQYIKDNTTPDHTSRKFKTPVDKDKDRIGHAISRALSELKKHNKKIYEHFARSIKSPYSYVRIYNPDVDIDWKF